VFIDPLHLDLRECHLYGAHNRENIAAAAMAAIAAGGNIQDIQTALNRFKGLSHRIEFVRKLHGVTFIDDSKATNVDAVHRALDAFDDPVVLIMGGRDKGGDYRILENGICKHVKHLIILGESADLIAEALGHRVPVDRVATMADAVRAAHHTAVPGDIVLLSPACASFDMFNSYAHRGDVFQSEVNHL
jgi:UDP-N-acetylmuramoylalanine--D-glutamate ligase